MGSQNEQALAEMLTNQLLSRFTMDHLSLLSHIADVTGHGYPSGLLMVACKFILTTLIEAGIPFDKRIDRTNRALVKHCDPTQFITFFHAEIYPHTHMMQYCNAGHNTLILVPETDEIQTVLPQAPLGIVDISYTIDTVPFDRKSKLVMYTDGITEAMNPGGDLYEDERLLKLVRDQRTQSAEDLNITILEDVSGFSAGAEHLDDSTLSIVELVRWELVYIMGNSHPLNTLPATCSCGFR